MRLISLKANKDSFKTVRFKNSIGLNFIVATQKEENRQKGDTTNGVGKSLLIALIHFCLGASKNEAFKNNLSDWIFTLEFSINNKIYTSERSTNSQEKIKLNGEEISTTEFNKKFGKLLFEIPNNVNQLSFRSLLPFFIRPRRASYSDYKNPNAVNNEFQILVTNTFLLGIDVTLAQEKFKLRQDKERIRKLVKELKNDKLLKDFFTGEKDIALTEQDLSEQIENLENDLKNFDVADDYYEIKEQADKIKRELEKIQNNIFLFRNQTKNIDESRKISPDIKKENIERIYKEASVIIKEDALKQLSELEKFYEHITSNREKRLLQQKNEITREIETLSTVQEQKSRELDNKLKYLGAHKALDVFVKLTNKLSDLKNKKENITKYQNLLEEYRKEKIRIDEDFINATKKTDAYLQDAQVLIKTLNDFYRKLSKQFYPDVTSGISIKNNDGDNQTRYDFKAEIYADASDGINNVKIFCYDLTLLIKGFGHKINTIFHDSRLLDGIDPLQKAEMFIILNDLIKTSNKQYILSLNQSQIDEFRKYLTEEQYSEIIQDNIILQLKDNSDEEKLLGIKVDMHY
jgi:uncharacterized protein YydD (DUF2326 family)